MSFARAVVGLALVAVALHAQAAPDGRPRTVQYLGSLSDHDPEAPVPGHEPWTPADVVDLLAAHPHASVALGRIDGLPPGNRVAERQRRLAEQVRALAAPAGVDVAERLCVPFRIDVQRKLRPGHPACDPALGGGGCDWEGDMDGSFGEPESAVRARGRATGGGASTLVDGDAAWPAGAWARRLLVLRPGTALEARRRIVGSDATTLQLDAAWELPPRAGDAYEIRGSFDPGWAMRVPAATHAASMRRFWGERRTVCGTSRTLPCAPPAEPLDPLAAGNARGWSAEADHAAFVALAAGGRVPALFGAIRDASPEVPHLTDPYPSVDSVVMDLRNPGYRAWRVRSLLYALRDLGVDPGAPACVILRYEPGLHARYDESEGPSTHPCALPDTASWQAPLHVCSNGSYEGGLLDPTAYGPGEFEAGVDALLRELLEVLPRHGYERTRLVTAESASFRGRPWTTLAADLRFDARLVGELDRARPPLLASVRGPIAGASSDGDGGAGGGAGRPSAAASPWNGFGGARAASGATGGKVAASATRSWSIAGASAGVPAGNGSAPPPPPARGSGSGSSWSIGGGGPSGSPQPSPTASSSAGRAPLASAGGSKGKATATRSKISVPATSRTFATAPTRATGSATPIAQQPAQAPPAPSPAPIRPSEIPTSRPPQGSHEPPGLTPRWPMNPMHSLPPVSPAPTDAYGYKCWPEQCRTLSIVRDESSPGSDPSVLRVGFPRSQPGGQAPSRFLAGNDFGGKRRLYTSVYYYLSPNWSNGGNAGTKFFFVRAGLDGAQNHYVGGPSGDGPFKSGIFLQTADGAGNRNMTFEGLPVGRWVRLEVYLEMNTPGVANGVAKLWLDGDLKVDESDVKWIDRIPEGRTLQDVSWDYLWADPTYGGGPNSPPEDMYFQIDDWYTSVGD
jgi:hypothetical protein